MLLAHPGLLGVKRAWQLQANVVFIKRPVNLQVFYVNTGNYSPSLQTFMRANQHFTLAPPREADQTRPAVHSCGRWGWFWFSSHHFLTHSGGRGKKVMSKHPVCLCFYPDLDRWLGLFISHYTDANSSPVFFRGSLTVYVEHLLGSSHGGNMMTAALPSHLPLTRIAHTLLLLFLARSDLCVWYCMCSQLEYLEGFITVETTGSVAVGRIITQSCVHARG